MSGVRYEVAAGVATLTLDEEDNKNALSATIINGLGEGITRALSDGTVRVIVLTNAGGTFCAGADLKSVGSNPTMFSFPEILSAMIGSPKPIIGRINGHCMGGGVGLAAACDISVANEAIKLGFTEVRIGVAAAMISVVCLPKLSRADASELFLTGRRISAAYAAEVGLINRAVPADELDKAVEEIVGEVIAGGPNALAASKDLLITVPKMELDKAFAHTAELSAKLFASDEATQGIAAFREKRPAPWIPASPST